MVVIRATQKVLRFLPKHSDGSGESTNTLGDWYVNRITVDRRPLLILVSSASLLSILTAAQSVKTPPTRLPDLVASRLLRLGISPNAIAREKAAMLETRVAPTNSKSIVGTMVDFGKNVPVYLPEGNWGATDLRYAEAQLGNIPSHLPGDKKRYMIPVDLALELFANS